MRLSAAIACVALVFSSTTAHAFVSPRWHAHENALRTAMIGNWQVVGGRHKGSSSALDLDIRLEIDADTIHVSEPGAGFVAIAKWSYVSQEGEIVTISLVDEHDRKHEVDVLVEGPDALTFYVQDDEGDDEEVLRLERLP